MGFGASQVLGIPISLYIANAMGWQAPFLMIVALASIVWVIVLIKLKPVTKHLDEKNEKNAILHLWNTVSQKHYRIGFLSTAILSIGGFMMMPWSSAFAINNLKITQQQLPIIFMVSGVSSLITMPLIGKFSDTIDKFKIFLAASIMMIIMVLIYTNLTPIPFIYIILFNIVFMVSMMSRMVPAMALTSGLPKMHDRGAFMSINASLQQIAGGVAAIIGGMIVVQKDKFSPLEHYNTLGVVISVLSVISILMVFRVSKMVKQRKAMGL